MSKNNNYLCRGCSLLGAVASEILILESCWGLCLAIGVTRRCQLYRSAQEYRTTNSPEEHSCSNHSLPVFSEIPIPKGFTVRPPEFITPILLILQLSLRSLFYLSTEPPYQPYNTPLDKMATRESQFRSANRIE